MLQDYMSGTPRQNPTREEGTGSAGAWQSLQSALEHLEVEARRLRAEHERLLAENRALREEVTMARLLRDAGLMPDTPPIPGLSLPGPARSLLAALPDSFHFGEFFQIGAERDLTYETAKEYLRLFLRERMLLQKGAIIEKTTGRSSRGTRDGSGLRFPESAGSEVIHRG